MRRVRRTTGATLIFITLRTPHRVSEQRAVEPANDVGTDCGTDHVVTYVHPYQRVTDLWSHRHADNTVTVSLSYKAPHSSANLGAHRAA